MIFKADMNRIQQQSTKLLDSLLTILCYKNDRQFKHVIMNSELITDSDIKEL